MIAAKAKIKFNTKKIANAAKRGNITSVDHAAAAIRLRAWYSIRKSAKKSRVGTPPNSRKGRLRKALKYAVSKSPSDGVSAVIGPDVARVGTSGQAHEFGGRYKKQHYQKRAFMGPALENVKPRLPAFWKNSIRGE